ncbi:MAG: response regulator [Photobacterium frigidiphilum]|uniref:response regulator transcription factor n=1 Tax=Photobacterium frigidiphilum TaxID=264736 RepID=UPI003002E487
MNKRVFLVDDDPMIRESITWMLEGDGFDVQAFDGSDSFLANVDLSEPGCAILDICMPGMNGIELQQILSDFDTILSVIFLTGHADVPTTAVAFKNGAIDLLQKPVEPDVLLASIEAALKSSDQKATLWQQKLSFEEKLSRLTPREKQLMELVVAGDANKTIADKLCLAQRTVEIHRHNLFKKMEVTSALQLVKLLPNYF